MVTAYDHFGTRGKARASECHFRSEFIAYVMGGQMPAAPTPSTASPYFSMRTYFSLSDESSESAYGLGVSQHPERSQRRSRDESESCRRAPCHREGFPRRPLGCLANCPHHRCMTGACCGRDHARCSDNECGLALRSRPRVQRLPAPTANPLARRRSGVGRRAAAMKATKKMKMTANQEGETPRAQRARARRT